MMDQGKQREMLTLFGQFRAMESAESWLNIETKRNVDNIDLFEAIIREAFDGVTLVVAGHHIMFLREGQTAPYEIASADTLIFDAEIALRIWKDRAAEMLQALAWEAPVTRDALLRKLYFERIE